MGDDIMNHGLTIEQIETDFKPMIESAGIKILSLSELRETSGAPVLIIEAESFKDESVSSEKKRSILFW